MSYQPRKAAQLIAALIIQSGLKSLNILKAVKLVYLVDRESIKRFGLPILEEQRVSMRLGPVNSVTYSHLNGEYDLSACGWSDVLRDRANHMIALADSSMRIDDLDELSDADLECVNTVLSEFGHMDKWQLVDWTHDPNNIPEWEDPDGGSTVIPLRRIMQAAGLRNVDDALQRHEALNSIDNAFLAARMH
ncbi:MAG: SocA family protein [Rhizobiaceae bacterium]|nr:SocA family protein [Rhizobiaceae bacterium]